MKLLFLTFELPDLGTGSGGFYADLIKKMAEMGHDVYAICSNTGDKDKGLYREGNVTVVRTRVPFLKTNTSLLRKGIGSLLMTPYYIRAIKQYLSSVVFDYIILPTPPATLVDVVKRINKQSKVYVILRDIQPECAYRPVSTSILNRTDVYDECKKPYVLNSLAKYLLYHKSQQLYKLATQIGCMSPGNIDYLRTIAPYLHSNQLKLLPNWYAEPRQENTDSEFIRKKYNLGQKFVAFFGGNIGPQQAIWNIAQLAKMNLDKKDVVFLVIGRGTKKHILEEIARNDQLTNILFLEYLPKKDYEALLKAADVGLISLDEKYRVPTCPSKIVGYMAFAKPVMAMINKGNDFADFYIDQSGCGLWSVDQDHQGMQRNFEWLYTHPEERRMMGLSGYNYFKKHFTVTRVCGFLDDQLRNA